MKNLKNRKYGYRAAAVLSAITMAGAIPITSFARNASKPDDAHVIAEPPAPDINKDLSLNSHTVRINGHPSGIMCSNSGS